MTHDVSQWVEEGSFEVQENGVEGIIKFAHLDHLVRLELLGTCGAQLAGCAVYFWNRKRLSKEIFPITHPARHQVGPSGRFEISGLHVSEEPDENYSGPQYGAREVLLEWYGQNGHFKILLEDATVEFLKNDEACYAPERLLCREARVGELLLTDLVPRIEPEGPDTRRFTASVMDEIRALDEAIEREISCDKPIQEHFDPPYQCPQSPGDMTDQEIEIELCVLLGKLARLGICVDLCSHFSLKDLYHCLLDQILESPYLDTGLTPTHGLEHFPTYEYCSKCKQELDEDFELTEEAMRDMEEVKQVSG